jgi:hypothetical protein
LCDAGVTEISGDSTTGTNVAVTFLFELMVIDVGFAPPLRFPLHEENCQDGAGCAVSVTTVS